MKYLVIKMLAVVFTLICFNNPLYANIGLFMNDQGGGQSPAGSYQSMQFKLGTNLGYQFPYSGGLEASFLFDELIEANLGGGFGFNGGAKIGLGARVYPIRTASISPMIGAYLFHAFGMSSLDVTLGSYEGEFEIPSDNAFLISGGARYRFGRGHYLILGAGYAVPFEGKEATLITGSDAENLQDFANRRNIDGFSLNVGILIKLSRGHFQE